MEMTPAHSCRCRLRQPRTAQAVRALYPTLQVRATVAAAGGFAGFPHIRTAASDISAAARELHWSPRYHAQQLAQPDLTQQLIRKDEFVVYCAANHRLAKRKSITLDDLAQERWAISAAGAFGSLLSLRQAFDARGLAAPRITLVSDLVMFKLRAVAGSDLVGVTVKGNVNAVALQLRLKILPVKDLDWGRPVAVAYRTHAYLSRAARRFIEILDATALINPPLRPTL